MATRLRGLVSSKASQVPDEDDDDSCNNILDHYCDGDGDDYNQYGLRRTNTNIS